MIPRLCRTCVVILSLSALACVSLSLAGEKVRVTKHESDVEGCRFLGEVEAHPPYHGPHRCRTGAGRVLEGSGWADVGLAGPELPGVDSM